MVGGDVVLRRRHRRFGDFGGQYAIEITRQRQREVTVAAVQFQQVAGRSFGDIQRPLQHLNVHCRVRLGKAVFHLTVDHLPTANRQAFIYIILIELDFSFGRPPNQMHIEPLGSQGVTQRLRLLTPGIVQLFMIQQRNDRLVAEGGQIVNLEQLMAQHGIVAYALQHGGHQLIDERAGGREAVNANPRPGLLIENNMVQIVAIVPQTELGAHTVVADRRTKHFRNRRGKRRHHGLQTDDFFCQLRFVLFGRKVFGGHDVS